MIPDSAAPDPAPRRYGLKPRRFIAENAPRGTEAPSADHDVHAILQRVRAREAAAGHVIASDGTVSVGEGELFRALAATLDCPMPAVGITG